MPTLRVTALRIRHGIALAVLAAASALWLLPASPAAQMPPKAQVTPKVGDKAADFTLQSLDGATVRLSEETARGPVVLVVLRGWPGYDCPFCTRQFSDLHKNADNFAKAGARVLLVYPGPGDGLQAHAAAFTASRPMPVRFRVLLDPDYTFTQAYGLRWDGPKETAYPSTFVVDTGGVVTFAHISREHGDRVTAETLLNVLGGRQR
jgi:thioredoxin-dependent peroxiredoxin